MGRRGGEEGVCGRTRVFVWTFHGALSVPPFSLFLLILFEQGGGLSLAFPTRTPPQWPHPSPESISLLSGVIATSPLLIITHPPSSIKRWLGGKLASVSPRTTIPAVVNGAVSPLPFPLFIVVRLMARQDLSRDPQVGELCAADPLIRQVGSLRGMSDMLSGVRTSFPLSQFFV